MRYTRFHILAGIAIVASTALAAPGVAEDQLALPTDEPELGVTVDEQLGTNDAGVGLSPGDEVPDFASHSFTGDTVSRDELVARGPLLIVFYRGGWCPYCNVQIRQLTLAYPEFETREILPVLISVDEADAASLAQATYEIPFPVLSDPDLHAHEAFGVVMDVDAETVLRYEEYGIDLEAWSGRDHHKIAVASAFLVDEDGIVRWAHSSRDYRTRPSPQQLLDAADAIVW